MVTKTLRGADPHGFHRVAYHEWGDPDCERVVVCAHGLTRNGRDFDALAKALSDCCRVVCPDMAGRGQSEWLSYPQDYGYPVYLGDAAALVARLGARRVDWVGTSMGGLIGMLLAANPGTPVRRLVLNDVGPFIPKRALERIAAYVGNAPAFHDLGSVEAYLREVHAPFGSLSDEQWRHLAEHSTRVLPDGTFALHYDPAIGTTLRAAPFQDVDLWAVWDAVRCPTLVLRGADSDLLMPEVAAEMARRGPRAQVVEVAGVGHAPALLAPDQIERIRSWLFR
ncbi:MAG: alpha/beta hydrolase [Deferrisomatales bacterium]|nr:alpha/beta hydrolase [Deferrisomatales bacterium]